MGEMKFKFLSEKRVFTFSHASLTVRVLLLSLGYYFMDFFKAEGEIKLNLWNRNEWWLTNEQMDRWTDRDKNWKLLESLSSLQKKHERFLLNFNPLRIWFDSHFTITSTIFFFCETWLVWKNKIHKRQKHHNSSTWYCCFASTYTLIPAEIPILITIFFVKYNRNKSFFIVALFIKIFYW